MTTNTEQWNDFSARGDLDGIKVLHKRNVRGCTTEAMDLAAKNGHFKTMVWLHENRPEGCSIHAIEFAAENGHFEIVEWLYECFLQYFEYSKISELAMPMAAENGHYDIVVYLAKKQMERTIGSFTDAIGSASDAEANTGIDNTKIIDYLEKWEFELISIEQRM